MGEALPVRRTHQRSSGALQILQRPSRRSRTLEPVSEKVSPKVTVRHIRNRVRREAPNAIPRPNIEAERNSRSDHGTARDRTPCRSEIAHDVGHDTIRSLGSSDLPEDREPPTNMGGSYRSDHAGGGGAFGHHVLAINLKSAKKLGITVCPLSRPKNHDSFCRRLKR